MPARAQRPVARLGPLASMFRLNGGHKPVGLVLFTSWALGATSTLAGAVAVTCRQAGSIVITDIVPTRFRLMALPLAATHMLASGPII